ncbi:hypothetical protein IQ225_14215 [Synechocystis salina LEGE 06155]|nr:hypothetical protein [Synechocystis salina LEGE 06155]
MDNPENYDVWSEKPRWCQPWTILLTGSVIIAASWLLFHQWWLSLPVAGVIALWWWYFLLAYPRLVRQAIAMDQGHGVPPKTTTD